jgi:hypothetical protein
MKTLLTKTFLAVGLAGGLGFGVVAVAQSNGPSTPPPSQSASPAQAQGTSAHRGTGDRSLRRHVAHRIRMRRLARRLQLTDTQRTAARQIHAKAVAEIRAARVDGTLTRDQRIARIRASVQAGRADFANLLTPDQHAKLDRIENRREQRLLGL